MKTMNAMQTSRTSETGKARGPIRCGGLWLALALTATMMLGLLPSRAQGQDLWPLAEFSKDRTVILYPFYVHEGDFKMIFPFYYRTNQGRDHHYLWPLVKFSEGRLKRAAPVWFSADADTFTVFPVMRQTPDYTFWTLPPIYTRHDGKFVALYPLFAKSPNLLFVAPSFYKHKNGDQNSLGIFPVYFSQWSPRETWSMAPFIYSYSKKGNDTEFWSLPLAYSRTADGFKYASSVLFEYSRQRQDFRFWLFPFHNMKTDTVRRIGLEPFWTYQERKVEGGLKKTLFLFPYCRVQSPRESTAFLLPFYFQTTAQSKDGESKDLWLFPWVQGSAPNSSYHGLLPVYFRARETRQGNEQRQTFNLLWPAYRREVVKSAGGDVLEYQRRFLFFSESRERSGARVFRVLGFPIVERTR